MRSAAIFGVVGLALVGVLAGAAEPTAGTNSSKKGNDYIRLVRGPGGQPLGLETAIVRFAPATGTQQTAVDLVGAVHIADKAYYQTLNKRFEAYDVLLYELVAPEGTTIPQGGRKASDNPVSSLQKGMKNLLELEFQLDQIDYTRPNFVHADMSPQQFAQSMHRRGESVSGMMMRMIGFAFTKQGQSTGNEAELLMALFDKNRAMKLKQVMAEQFADMDWMLGAIDGPDGSTIISERNKAALAVLRKQLAAGKRKAGIFYGAAHMVDMQKRLEKEFGMKAVETRWVRAWDLQRKR